MAKKEFSPVSTSDVCDPMTHTFPSNGHRLAFSIAKAGQMASGVIKSHSTLLQPESSKPWWLFLASTPVSSSLSRMLHFFVTFAKIPFVF
jgi:hypothetical protein